MMELKPRELTTPVYHVPVMREIAAIQSNGLSAISTFSGGGGSSTGYHLAGFDVLWANEFIPEALATYRANWPETKATGGDIREIAASDILRAIGLGVGELDLFDGSPPCASFSTAGAREKYWGKEKKYSTTRQRADDLFEEYIRLVRDLRPRVFVAENVSGLVKGVAKGYFLHILRELTSCGYRVEARLLDAQWLGVPQMRQRIFFLGVREDQGFDPTFPTPLPYRYTLRDALADTSNPEWDAEAHKEGLAIADLSKYGLGVHWKKLRPGESPKSPFLLTRAHFDRPCPTITATAANIPAAAPTHPNECRKFTVPEYKRICSFPDDYRLTGDYSNQVERTGRAVPPVLMGHVARQLAKELQR